MKRFVVALVFGLLALGVAAPTAQAYPYGYQGGYTEVEAAIDATFPAAVADDFKLIAYRESGFNPYAINPYSGACGPFQFLPSTAAYMGTNCYALTDPWLAAAAAYQLYTMMGFSPWALTY